MKNDTKASNKYAVPALDKGLDVLEYLVFQELPKTQAEIALGIGRSANEIYRVLVGLEARGYIMREDLSGRYRASLKLYNLSRSISPIDRMRQCALPHMEDLAVRVGHSCHLSMLYQSQTMVIIQARSHSPVSVDITEGTLFPTVESTSGKILLANSNDPVREMILERDKHFLAYSAKTKASFFTQLSSIQGVGHCIEKNHLIEGVIDFAALIGQAKGKVIAALSISILKNSMSQTPEQTDLMQQIQQTANTIATQLGSE